MLHGSTSRQYPEPYLSQNIQEYVQNSVNVANESVHTIESAEDPTKDLNEYENEIKNLAIHLRELFPDLQELKEHVNESILGWNIPSQIPDYG